MRELAARLGVSAMTTYRYFESKDDIFATLRVQTFNGLAERLEHLLDQGGAAPERFAAFCQGYVDFAREEPVRYKLMFDQSPQLAGSVELAGARDRLFQAFIDQAHLLAPAGRAPSNPERLAQNLWASLHGLAALITIDAFREYELDGLIRDMTYRFSASAGRPAELNHKALNSTTAPHPNWGGRRNGAPISGWMPVTVAD
jgi:AcrR family transcriptional regulator